MSIGERQVYNVIKHNSLVPLMARKNTMFPYQNQKTETDSLTDKDSIDTRTRIVKEDMIAKNIGIRNYYFFMEYLTLIPNSSSKGSFSRPITTSALLASKFICVHSLHNKTLVKVLVHKFLSNGQSD